MVETTSTTVAYMFGAIIGSLLAGALIGLTHTSHTEI